MTPSDLIRLYSRADNSAAAMKVAAVRAAKLLALYLLLCLRGKPDLSCIPCTCHQVSPAVNRLSSLAIVRTQIKRATNGVEACARFPQAYGTDLTCRRCSLVSASAVYVMHAWQPKASICVQIYSNWSNVSIEKRFLQLARHLAE